MSQLSSSTSSSILTESNFLESVYCFRDRQAGVSVIYDPGQAAFQYNAYCLEKKLLKDLVSVEFRFLSDALGYINSEFGNWPLLPLSESSSGCGSCVAKK